MVSCLIWVARGKTIALVAAPINQMESPFVLGLMARRHYHLVMFTARDNTQQVGLVHPAQQGLRQFLD